VCDTVEVLHRNGTDFETLAALQTDVAKVNAEAKDKTLLLLAATITRDPASAAQAVLDASRAGWSKDEVAEAIFVVSMYNMANRVAVAFALPPDEAHPYDPDLPLPMLSCKAH
jgi:alkylhydroperoxidase family enzyme